MIKAKNLTYKAITNAMLEGNLYSSEGPEIYDLYVEDGKVTIKCSPCQRIAISRHSRKAGVKVMENDKPVTEATFDVSNPNDGYFRITITDLKGKRAFTNAYFPEDIGL